MITKSQPANTLLPGFMLAACVAIPDSTRGPSFHRVFWPTAGVSLLSYALAGVLVINCAYSQGECDKGDSALVSTVALIVVAIAPPIAAKIAGGSFGKGFLGGVGGFAAGGLVVLLARGIGVDSETLFWAPPAGQAIFTALLSMR